MKETFLLISIFCICSTFSFAQKPIRQTIKTNTDKTKLTDSPVKILYKPRAAYPNKDSGSVCFTGVVRLRVKFLDSGEIGEIAVISALPYGATENAVEAAKKIKFNPARKDGKPVTVSKVVEFSFTLY